jgi:exodeoxyribonuclease V alpha subunit
LFKEYGAGAVNVLRQNPYQLVRDIPGVGFKTADDIARKMGQADNSPNRISAGIHYVIEAAAGKGHCALPRADLIARAKEVLNADHDLVESNLDALLDNDQLICQEIEAIPLVFAIEYLRAEESVASLVKAIAAKPANYPNLEPEQAVSLFEQQNGFTLGEEQARAVKEAMQNRIFIITGGPGVGKTTILNAILQILVSKGVEPVLCAPTGRASKRLNESTGREASTIHRLLEFQPGGGFSRGREKRLEGDLFVVDEASMIDIKLMADFLEALPDNGHLILVGDIDQLPSVGPGIVLSDLIESGSIPVARLTRIFRQAQESRIISAAHAINQGSRPEMDNESTSDFFFFERKGPAIIDTLKQLIRERIPNKFGFDARDDIQVLTPMNRNTLGTKALNAELQTAINPPDLQKFEIERFGILFRKGDKVIQTRNNYEKEVFNGDIGYILEINNDPGQITVAFDGNREVDYEPGDLDELQLAYAITIHKSQGSEFPAVIIPLASEQFVLLQRNLIYTGITRGKKLVILVGEKKALDMAIRNRESSQRWTGLKWRLS